MKHTPALLLALTLSSCAMLPSTLVQPSACAADTQAAQLHVGGRGARVDESHIQATFFVDQKVGNDANQGTSARPVATILRAFALASQSLGAGQATKVVVRRGVYREALGYGPSNLYHAPFVLEGTNRDACIISASDRFVGWSGPDAQGAYSHAWKQKWGTFPGPDAADPPAFPSEMGRYENVVVDEKMMLPRVAKAELKPGTFFVDEASEKLFLLPPQGVDPNDARHDVEVTTRINGLYDEKHNRRDSSILHFYRPEPENRPKPANVVVRGLTFENAPGGLFNSALNFQNTSNCLVENIRVRNCGYDGFSMSGNGNTVRNCLTQGNGEKGFGADGDGNLFENVTLVRNCLKGAAFGWNGWDGGAFKCGSFTNSTVRGFKATGNGTKGMWFDTSCVGDLVENCVMTGNSVQYADGLFWENNNRNTVPNLGSRVTGLIRGCRFENNWTGFFVAESENVVLDRCVMRNNGAQLAMYNGTNPPRGIINNVAFSHCTLASFQPTQHLFGIDEGHPSPSWTNQFLLSLRADAVFGTNGNRYISPSKTPFRDSSGKEALDFAGWQLLLMAHGAEANSTFSPVPRNVVAPEGT